MSEKPPISISSIWRWKHITIRNQRRESPALIPRLLGIPACHPLALTVTAPHPSPWWVAGCFSSPHAVMTHHKKLTRVEFLKGTMEDAWEWDAKYEYLSLGTFYPWPSTWEEMKERKGYDIDTWDVRECLSECKNGGRMKEVTGKGEL